MALSPAMADKMFNGFRAATRYVSLHSGRPTAGNRISGPGYAPVTIAQNQWTLADGVGKRLLRNTDAVQFPTPGGNWTEPTYAALWDRQPTAQDAVLLRSKAVDVKQPIADTLVAFAAGELRFEIVVV